MKIMLSAALLLALIAPVRAEDKPAAGAGGNPEIKAEHEAFKSEMKGEREAFKAKQHEKRKAHREKMKAMRQKARQERKEKKAADAPAAPKQP